MKFVKAVTRHKLTSKQIVAELLLLNELNIMEFNCTKRAEAKYNNYNAPKDWLLYLIPAHWTLYQLGD